MGSVELSNGLRRHHAAAEEEKKRLVQLVHTTAAVGNVGSALHMVGPRAIRSGHTKQECFGQPRRAGGRRDAHTGGRSIDGAAEVASGQAYRGNRTRGRREGGRGRTRDALDGAAVIERRAACIPRGPLSIKVDALPVLTPAAVDRVAGTGDWPWRIIASTGGGLWSRRQGC